MLLIRFLIIFFQLRKFILLQENVGQGDFTYLAQVTGKSVINLKAPKDCEDSCKKNTMTMMMHEGDICE